MTAFRFNIPIPLAIRIHYAIFIMQVIAPLEVLTKMGLDVLDVNFRIGIVFGIEILRDEFPCLLRDRDIVVRDLARQRISFATTVVILIAAR